MQPISATRLHDMRTCLALGETPTQPIYTGLDLEKAEYVDRSGRSERLWDFTFGEGQTNRRGVEVEFREVLLSIFNFITLCGDFGLNPVEGLKKAFPGWEWQCRKLKILSSREFQRINYAFPFGPYWILASNVDCGHKFFVSHDKIYDDEHEGVFAKNGFTLVA